MAQANYFTNAIRALITGARAKPSTGLVPGVHIELPAFPTVPPARTNPVDVVDGWLGLRPITAVLSDPASDVTGTIQHDADGAARRFA